MTQSLSGYLAREGAGKKSEQVLLTKDAMKAFEALKQACITSPILVFADYTTLFLLETDASKDKLGVVCHRSRQMGSITLLPMAVGPDAT